MRIDLLYGGLAARLRCAVAVLAMLAPSLTVVSAADRVALVVGNGAYDHIGELPNPKSDAVDVSAALNRLGFDVTTVFDATRPEFFQALREFTRASVQAAVALVFYAGHGMEMDGVNYLLPVDARLERDTDVRYETVTLEDVLAATNGAALRLVILDACRNNPLARSMQRTVASRSVSQGSFGEFDDGLLGHETLVAYSAAAGTTAADGDGRNSPYTSALLTFLEQPLEVGVMFRRVRARVLQLTSEQQRPHEYQSLLAEHYLGGGSSVPPAAVSAADATSPSPIAHREQLFWEAIADSEDAEDYRAYVEEYPEGVYVRLARSRMAALSSTRKPPAVADLAGDPPTTPTVTPLPGGPGMSVVDSRRSDAVARLALLTESLGRELTGSRKDQNDWTDLHYAALLNAPDAIRRLVAQGANVNARLREDGKPLSVELRNVLRRLGHEEFDTWTRDEETPLHVAAFVNAKEAVVELLASGADIDRGTKFDWRALHYAAWADASEVVELLLMHGARSDAKTDEVSQPGRTALEVANQAGSRRAAQALRAARAR